MEGSNSPIHTDCCIFFNFSISMMAVWTSSRTLGNRVRERKRELRDYALHESVNGACAVFANVATYPIEH